MPTITYSVTRIPPFPCEYHKDGRVVRYAIQRPVNCSHRELYNILSLKGSRRENRFIFRTECPACRCCISSRVPADLFRPDRTMERVRRKNRDLVPEVLPCRPTRELYGLYLEYVNARHAGGSMASFDYGEFGRSLFESCTDTRLIVHRLNGEPVICAIVDVLSHGISAVYTFFSPRYPSRSLGIFSILREIDIARTMGPGHFLYLGYWVPEVHGMDYKERFKPFEIYWRDAWRSIEDCRDEVIAESRNTTEENARLQTNAGPGNVTAARG